MCSNGENSKIFIQVTDSKPTEVMQKIIENGQEDGFYVCNVSDIIEKFQKWKYAMPRVKPYFAIKVNDIRVVTETLAALGTGFDCASVIEIMKILSIGVSPNRIIFANPTKTIRQLKYACEVGVSKMTFDCEEELFKIKNIFPQAELVLRIKYDDPKAMYSLGKKFGADPKTEAEILLKTAKSLNLNVIGVAFHIGSGSKDFTVYQKAIASAKQVFDIGLNLGFNFHLLDIGGGFPGNQDDVIFEIGKFVNEALDICFPDESVEIISEPGKYFVDSAFTLAACIHTTKTIKQNESNKSQISKIYYSNMSMYQSLMPVAFGEEYVPSVLFEKSDTILYPSIVWGATCDSCDILSRNIELPELKNGDWLYFENSGAYTLTLSCEFNGYPTTSVHSIISNKDWELISREAQTPIPKDRFVFSEDPKYFKISLGTPDFIYNKYF